MNTAVRLSIPKAIGAITLTRFAIDTAFRAQLPYLAAIAVVLGSPPEAASGYAAVQGLAGFVAPFGGVLAYRFGSRNVYLVGLVVFITFALLIGLSPTLFVAALFCLGMAVAKVLVDVQGLSFIGEVVPYEKRGMAMGIGELPWSAAWIVGVPLFGVLISRVAWWTPFVAVAGVALIGTLLAWRYVLPHMRRDPSRSSSPASHHIARIIRLPRARAIVLFGLLVAIAAQVPYLIYPLWMRGQFNLSLEQLGFASIVIGIADALAELAAVFVTDRLGKGRTISGGCAIFAAGFAMFWLSSEALPLMMAALFVIYFGFELALVASLPVTTEVLPEARSVMMGFGSASFAGGRVIGSLIALPLFGADRLWLVSLVCIGIIALAMLFARQATSARSEVRTFERSKVQESER